MMYTVSFNVPPATLAAITAQANQMRISRAHLVREAVAFTAANYDKAIARLIELNKPLDMNRSPTSYTLDNTTTETLKRISEVVGVSKDTILKTSIDYYISCQKLD